MPKTSTPKKKPVAAPPLAANATKTISIPAFVPHKDVDASSLFGRIPAAVWFAAFLLSMLFHLETAPYSKVEESFHTQAVHDLIFYGPHQLAKFDHKLFPGPVKRTFIGSVLLWIATLPITIPVLHMPNLGLYHLLLPHTKIAFQYLVRAVLAATMATSLTCIHTAVRKVHGHLIGGWFSVLCLSQFHLMFWGSRTLSNIFALVCFNMAFAYWIRSNLETKDKKSLPIVTPYFKLMLYFLAFGSIVFRAELALPSGLIITGELFDTQRFTPPAIILIGAVAATASLSITVAIDSYFWEEVGVWPELESFMFNVVEERSKDWGVSSYHSYFTSLVPRIAPLSFAMSFVAWRFSRSAVHRYWRVVYAFLVIYSILAHKEWRFVIYVMPMLNLIAAIGLARLYEMAQGINPIVSYSVDETKQEQSGTVTKDPLQPKPRSPPTLSPRVASLIIFAVKMGCFGLMVMSLGMLYVSSFNYPGGEAFSRVHQIVFERYQGNQASTFECNIHIDTFSAVSGVTRFGECSDHFPVRCTYSKYENHTTSADFVDAGYTYLLTSVPDFHLTATVEGKPVWNILEAVNGYEDISIEPLFEWQMEMVEILSKGEWSNLRLPVKPILSPKVYILSNTLK
ncbi:hypothetical protein BATDEDRAFT_89648 [Batrachochytrium dendrobatidis JAM81]|uniref:Mannosyltransferase n=1 Tax=Batrachochytrium dendrobatidis (strain JAM81 / FGSC 10211) TaxID=684364 RepID=F4P6A7_BATDJ|nr:dolichyl-P-Man:Man(7)GlcNAc(2)-PP-dolichol alpha-1,6-mannosyltransferase [Batrachochytrium dendrobatidis JAM81]EGF79315.1 hypothetical protein BATDEDRAFT_89648 [Batrachochytrium dendrobatidis JAM81]|eukprot:XP_006680095.1 hypothetical protein BATDEDRAFT_89648 [Batrachochytrium dendrobatidis JAM81]